MAYPDSTTADRDEFLLDDFREFGCSPSVYRPAYQSIPAAVWGYQDELHARRDADSKKAIEELRSRLQRT
jgi:hypothetical protein